MSYPIVNILQLISVKMTEMKLKKLILIVAIKEPMNSDGGKHLAHAFDDWK